MIQLLTLLYRKGNSFGLLSECYFKPSVAHESLEPRGAQTARLQDHVPGDGGGSKMLAVIIPGMCFSYSSSSVVQDVRDAWLSYSAGLD